MKSFSSFLFLLFVLLQGSMAQVVTTEQVFPVTGYSVFENGYPLKVTEGRSNRFAYLEYWAEGKEKRRISNYYLQSYGTRNYIEHWFKPVTNEGFEGMQVKDLLRLERVYAVIGRQYLEEERTIHTVCRFFLLDGTPKNDEPKKLSTYERKQRKGFRDTTVVSPGQKAMLWAGTDGKNVLATTWNEMGNKIWDTTLTLPFLNERYKIKEIMVDDGANPVFLLVPIVPASAKPLILVKYLHEKKEYYTEQIVLPDAGSVIHAHCALRKGGGMVVAGVVADGAGVGIRNGAKFSNQAYNRVWNQVFLKSYEPKKPNSHELMLVGDKVSPVPGRWLKRYSEEGANFNLSKLIVSGEHAIFLLEENYETRKKLYYYDVACLAFKLESGELVWNEIINKRQRDTHSDAFMSYVAGVSRGKLRIVYLTERGAQGKLLCTSVDLQTGRRKDKMLASNEEAKYLFFPKRSGMVSNYDMVLIGRGNPSQNDYSLITISF